MPSPRVIESRGGKDVVTHTIRIGGNAIPKTIEVAGISVFKGVARIPFAYVEILDGDPAAQTFAVSGNPLFSPGGEIEILAGYHSQEDVIFKGVIIGQRLRIRQQGRGLLTLHCRHPLYQATLSRRCRHWREVTDAGAVAGSFDAYGIATAAQPGGAVHPGLVQYDASDWDFAVLRAAAAGLLLVPTDTGADLKAPDFSQAPALALQFGATVLELDAELDIRSQPAAVAASFWDPSGQELGEAEATEPDLPAAGNLSATDAAAVHGQDRQIRLPGAAGAELLQAFADAGLLFRRLGWLVGRVRCTGTPLPLPGCLLTLDGAGDRFSGDHLVSAVRHTIGGGVWTTDIQFGLAEAGEPPGPPPVAAVPASRGLHLGVVEAIATDPDGELRIEVSLPLHGEGAAPVFARLASFDAGPDRGAVFFPEVGDEVVLAFLEDDPRHAVVLGALHSSANAPPIQPAEGNPEKGYQSRSGMKLVFNDETTVLRLETPAGNSLTLSEEDQAIVLEDQHRNRIVLDAEGIHLESATALKLKAATDVSVEGVNVTAEASGSFTASGSAGAELSASGNTTVRGALVQIN